MRVDMAPTWAVPGLFSKAKFGLGENRQRLTPGHFESQLLLNLNSPKWNEKTVQDIGIFSVNPPHQFNSLLQLSGQVKLSLS